MSDTKTKRHPPLVVHTVGQPMALHGLARLLLAMHLQQQAQNGLQLVHDAEPPAPATTSTGATA